ncbi:MAG: undecaprenyl-diphosphate phosphatase [Phycisphaerales bacterium]|nr:undecaprenyl-diphosphate phosphatase [Phycisphaerales bacterium]
MSDILRAVILGIVEGLTEFVPVSSTGHMILVMPLLGIDEGDPSFRFWNGAFDIFIQLGAILAVLIYFWRRLWRLTFRPADTRWHEHILVKLLVAFIPAAVIGLLASDFIEDHLKNPSVTATALVVGGVAILLIEYFVRHPRITDAATISLRLAFTIGLIQCLAMVPGTSRSGATIMGALALGLTPAAAAEFSFFLAIPTMFAAGFYSLLKHIDEIGQDQWVILAVGFVVAFLVAWVVVAAFMRFIQSHKFTVFAVYRIIFGGAVLVYLLSRT